MPEEPSRPPTNYRRNRQQADRRYLLLVVGALLIVGGGLIYLIWDAWAFATAFVCLSFGAGVILFLWGLLSVIERWTSD